MLNLLLKNILEKENKMDEKTECCFNCEYININTNVCAIGQAVENYEWETKKCKNFKMYTLPIKNSYYLKS